MWHRTIDCLGVGVSIESTVASIASQLEAVFRTYADATSPRFRYELRNLEIVRNGELVATHESELDLVGGLTHDLYPQVVRFAKGVVLHAGAVAGRGGRAIVFAGVSGAGKSTLMRALLTRGFDYLSEECVSLLPDGTCRGLARALHIEDPHIAVPRGFTSDDYDVRLGDTITRMRLFHPPSHRVWRGSAHPVALITLRHSVDAANTLTPLSNGEALLRLWPMTFQGAIGAPLQATTALASAPGYALETRSPEEAERLVLALAEELDVVPR